MLTHGNVVADFSGFLKVTEVNKVGALMQVSLEDTFRLERFFYVCFLFFPNIIWTAFHRQEFVFSLGQPHFHRHF